MSILRSSLCATAVALAFSNQVNALPIGNGYEAEIELTAVSDYRYHGISQTLGNPAAQAGLTLNSPLGLYVGTWISNVDYGPEYKTRFEQDYYVGWYLPLSDDLSVNVGWWKYTYKKSSELNDPSYYAVIDYRNIELLYQWSAGEQAADYVSLGYTYPITEETKLKVRYGYNDYKDPVIFASDESTRNHYSEWEARLEHDYAGLNFNVSFVDTDLSKTECISLASYDDLCSANLIVGVTKKF